RLARDPNVESVEPDARRYPMQADPFIADQWNLTGTGGGANVVAAWGSGTSGLTGATGFGVTVAVLDTGVVYGSRDLSQPTTRLLIGVDLVSRDTSGSFGPTATSNDGTGRDADASDPGNWITAAEAGNNPFQDCPTATDSDWHGTHTSGIIAANRNNVIGIAGVAYQSNILPVRILGKCGGYTSDIADGIRYAAGFQVNGAGGACVATAATAKVINLSLGATGGCSTAEQTAITAALGAGVRAIVAAAGNDNGAMVSTVAPANCAGVIAVAAVNRTGARAAYTNIGPGVALSGPGGTLPSTCVNGSEPSCTDGILSTFNDGRTGPVTDPVGGSYAYVIGTSEAAAHVSGVAALMLSVNGNLTATQLTALIRSSARAFPAVVPACTTTDCGAGIVDAAAAATAARAAPLVAFTPSLTNSCSAIADPDAVPASSGGGGGGGGCVFDPNGRPDVLLAMLALIAMVGVIRRRRVAVSRVSR
ncbi:MAG: S8 family serine peptidase, partial [Burkholderiales bacterium]